MIAPPPAAQDLGPWRIDLLLAIWPRIARAVDTMHGIGAVGLRADELKWAVDAAAAMGSLAFVHRDLVRTLCVMASVENMHVNDWLRRTVYESQLPRRKPPTPADLQIRLRGLSCRRLVATMDAERDSFRVTIKNLRGDVASCESHDFINALEGAIKMAGARADRMEDSEQDRRDHRRLAGDVAELLAHEDAMRVPIAVRRLVDAGVEPIVVAKTLAIGDWDGGLMYRLSTRAGAFALAEHEAIAVDWISLAIRDADPDLATDVMVSGATWLATQYGVDRELLVNLVTGTPRRPPRIDRRGYGVVDVVDHHGVGDRASIATAIRLARLPMFAALEGAPFRGPV